MTELPERSLELLNHPAALEAADLLRYYSFELEEFSIDQQLLNWLTHYPAKWVQLAVVEALYQGRYKAISVEQILGLWQRRGQSLHHFNHEFERLVSSKISRAAIAHSPPPPTPPPPTFQKPTLSYRKMLLQLPSADAASRLERLTEIPSLKLAKLAENNLSTGLVPPTPARPDTTTQSSPVRPVRPEPVLPSLPEPQWSNGNGMPRSPTATERDRLSEEEDFRKFKEGVIFALSSGLAAQALHPTLRLRLSQHYSLDWEKFNLTLAQIEQY